MITAGDSPTKVVRAQADGGASKIPDRMPGRATAVKSWVSREEAPVDVNSRSGARAWVFPPLNGRNSSPPPVAERFSYRAGAGGPSDPLACSRGDAPNTMPNKQPRNIKALTVKGDAAENGGIPRVRSHLQNPTPLPDRHPRQLLRPSVTHRRHASANAPPTLSPQSAPASDPAPPTRARRH